MKRTTIFGLALGALALLASGRPAQARNDERGERQEPARVHSPHVVVKMRQVAVPMPRPVQDARHLVRDERRAEYPKRDDHGVAIVKEASRVPPEHGMILGNSALLGTIVGLAAVETQRDHYYWHTDNGVRYAHYYDAHGTHWYWFYHGTTCYWTRYYENRWWWHDDHFNRWVYFADDHWWWQAPNGVSYVYVDNNYYPYEQGGVVTVKNAELQAPPSTNPAPNEGRGTASPDDRRMVQIFGEANEAFLYDQSSGKPVFLRYLGQDVDKVRFSGGTSGRALQILLDFKDGSFAMFDADGNTLEAPAAPSGVPPGATTEALPPPAPGDQPPPPPPGVPGQ